eukprot:5115498-Amphidinium_carterae.1
MYVLRSKALSHHPRSSMHSKCSPNKSAGQSTVDYPHSLASCKRASCLSLSKNFDVSNMRTTIWSLFMALLSTQHCDSYAALTSLTRCSSHRVVWDLQHEITAVASTDPTPYPERQRSQTDGSKPAISLGIRHIWI